MHENSISVHYGAFVASLEEQVNEMGFTLGQAAERIQSINDSILTLHFADVITDSEYRKALKRFQDRVLLPELKKLGG